jgi:hypothetical protein
MISEQVQNTTRKERTISFLLNENTISLLLTLISFCVYLFTMCRSVGFTDSGELAAVVCTLGIAHPTGYPLFTLLGRIWAMIPGPFEEILRLNIFTALLVALSVGIFFKTTLTFYRSVRVFQLKNQKRKEFNDHRFIFASALASLVLGFSTTFWLQSAAFEVYALHLVLILLALWTFVSGLEEQLKEQFWISRKLILFAFVLGLCFANHMTTILLAPGCLWLYFRTFKMTKESFRRILILTPYFLLGLSIYLYLPIRSAAHPLFDWGHPATPERFFWHISGKQFRIWMFSGWSVVQKQLAYYFNNFTSEFFFATFVCIAAGIIAVWKRSYRLGIFFTLLFMSTIIYSVNYDIFDISPYFLLSFIIVGWTLAYGIEFLFEWSIQNHVWVRIVVFIVLPALPVLQILNNWNRVDETKSVLPQQFVQNAFTHFEPSAVVIASQWDYFISPSWYYQFIRNERRDVTIIDKSLLQNRSWYFLQLQHQAPWLMERIHPSVDLFLAELDKFEHDLPFNFKVIQSAWQNLLHEVVEKSYPDHPVYVDVRIHQEFSTIYHRTPAGLFLRLSKTEDTVSYRTSVFPFGSRDSQQPVVMDFERYYVTMLSFEAEWLLKRGRVQEARVALSEILRLEPGNAFAVWFMRQSGKNQ